MITKEIEIIKIEIEIEITKGQERIMNRKEIKEGIEDKKTMNANTDDEYNN